ncbi:MAG TPA: O-antigen ligase family protein [Ktedonobacteraceae bacterium]|nr:O-antigen ligase family protein [Ktedonobacteraceae bacterium]HVU69872.1 O-antigen ligase family protein [Ktedonobacteraceae bacterium]
MGIFRISGLQQNHAAAWLRSKYRAARSASATTTLVGVAGVVLAVVVLLVPPLPWNIRIPFYLLLLIWTILRPRLALYLMAFAVPWGSFDYISAGGLRLNCADLLVCFLALGWLLSWGLPTYMGGGRDREKGRVPVYLLLAILLLLGVMFLSMTVAISRKDSLKEIAKWLEFFVLAMVGAQYLRTRRQVWTLVCFIIAGAISQAFFGYAQAIFNLGPQSFVRDANLRVYGTFDQPNPYAGYLNMALAMTISVLLLGRNWLTRVLAGLATCLIGGAFYLTQSRGGQVALASALLVIVLVGMPYIRVWLRILLAVIFALLLGMVSGIIPLYLFDQVNHFLGLTGISLQDPTPATYSTAERLAHWIAGINMYLTHPVLGVGIGNYPDAYASYYVTIFVNSLGQAHNYYINIAAETGTLGLVIYLFFVISLLVAGSRAVRQVCVRRAESRKDLPRLSKRIQAPLSRHDKLMLLVRPARFLQHYRRQERFEVAGRLTNDRALAIGLLASLVTICVHNLVDDLYDHSLTNLMALLLISLIALGKVTSRVTFTPSHGASAPADREEPAPVLTPTQMRRNG